MALVYGDTFESSSASISIRRSPGVATGVGANIVTSRPKDNGTPTVCTQESGGKFVGDSIENAQEMIKAHHTRWAWPQHLFICVIH